jgi:hypothetical protein
MQDLEVTPLNNNHDLYKVCLEDNGVRACTLVSSMHLVEDKRRQLKRSVFLVSARAFDE